MVCRLPDEAKTLELPLIEHGTLPVSIQIVPPKHRLAAPRATDKQKVGCFMLDTSTCTFVVPNLSVT